MSNNLSNVRICVDADLVDLVPDYIEKRKAELSLIPDFIKRDDFVSIQRIGHRLRGNASLFGLDWLAEKGTELENVARSEEQEAILSIGKQMYDYLNKVEFEPYTA